MKLKLLLIIVIFVMSISILPSESYAIGDLIGKIFDQQENWEIIGKDNTGSTFDTGILNELSDHLFSLFLGVGTVVAVIIGGILGIQFMTAGIDKKVEVKQAFFAYVISCIVMFSAFGIWKLVVIIMGNIVG